MRVLLSIKPEFAEKILRGEKLYEFRKSIFKNSNVSTIVIYATMPVGKIVGEFDFDEVLSDTPSAIWSETSAHSGITKKFFNTYFSGRARAHAIRVGAVRRYKIPVPLAELLPGVGAPQSYRYLDDSISWKDVAFS